MAADRIALPDFSNKNAVAVVESLILDSIFDDDARFHHVGGLSVTIAARTADCSVYSDVTIQFRRVLGFSRQPSCCYESARGWTTGRLLELRQSPWMEGVRRAQADDNAPLTSGLRHFVFADLDVAWEVLAYEIEVSGDVVTQSDTG